MGSSNSANMQAELEKLKEDVHMATDQERWLDQSIAQMQQSLRELADDETNAQYAYVTHEDVRNIPAFAPDTVIAIKAPSGTTLEVPDPDEGMEYPQRRYQIYLKSQSGPVEVFLVSTAEGEGEDGGAASTSAAALTDAPAADAADATRSSKRAREEGSEEGSSVEQAQSAAPALRQAEGATGVMQSDGLLKLNPIGESDTDYWSNAPPSHELGVADLFFVDSDAVKVEG